MKINSVLYLLRDNLENLPPSMSQIMTMCRNGYKVKVVSVSCGSYIREFFADYDVEFVSLNEDGETAKKRIEKAAELIKYRKLVRRIISGGGYDLLWVGSADTARYLKDIIEKNTCATVLNIYELYDKNPEVLRAIAPVAQKAERVVVPEYNRAHILKVWLGLERTPTVIPNKPCFKEIDIFPETEKIVNDLKHLNKKIVLYQGWIGKDRDVSQIARALAKLENKDEYALVLLGKVTYSDTIEAIKKIFGSTVYIPFLMPPQHLFITELAHMGIATYNDSSLNNIFCAPNKIYEYAQKNVPVLARDIPGLANTIGKYKAGVCTNMDNVDDIAAAVKEISENHEKYVEATKTFLDECNVEGQIINIIKNCEGAEK